MVFEKVLVRNIIVMLVFLKPTDLNYKFMKLIKYSVKLSSLVVILLVTVLPSCKTISSVQFQSLEAPHVVLPADVSRIAFVDRNQYFPSDSVEQYYSINGIIVKDSIDQTKNMSLNSYQGFVENMSEFWNQDSIPFVRLPKKMMPDTLRHFEPLSWAKVTSICKSNQVDVLVVLEDILAFTKHIIVESDLYLVVNEIQYQGVWRIYDPLYEKVYDERLMVDSLFMEVSGANYKKLIREEMTNREELLNDAAYELGRSYVDLISPAWKDVSRNYFVSGDKRLSTAVYFMEKEEFDTAINMWTSLTTEKDMKLAGRAAYNLAVVSEMKGDLKNAKGWVRKAMYFYKKLKKLPNEYKEIEAYALILDSRWLNGKKIKRFFGEE